MMSSRWVAVLLGKWVAVEWYRGKINLRVKLIEDFVLFDRLGILLETRTKHQGILIRDQRHMHFQQLERGWSPRRLIGIAHDKCGVAK